jgi:subtilisin family serine protease
VNADISRYRSFPASYNLANIIAVAATNGSNTLASYSNYGTTSVDIAAPGSSIYSTSLGNTYERVSGTSFSSPYVAGTVALLLSTAKSLSVAQIKARIMDGADESSSLYNTNASHGLLQVDNALANTSGTTAVEVTVPVFGIRPRFRRPFDFLFGVLSSNGDSGPVFFG